MFRRLAAELFGTFWLVFAVLGTSLFASGFPTVGVGFLGVALAAGLAVTSMAYAVGPVSGGHFNPAISLGLAVAGRFPWQDLIAYWIAQVLGGIAAAALVFLIASGKADFIRGGFAANGYDALSPGGYSMTAAFLLELVLTGALVMVVLGATSKIASPGFAPLGIGLCLTVAYLIGIPVTNASVNPARSIAAAIFAENDALGQLWLFIVAPLLGGAIGGVLWRYLVSPDEPEPPGGTG